MAALSALGARNDTAAAQVVWETALGLTKLGIHHELLPPGLHRYACRYVIMVPDHVRGSARTVIHVFEPPRQERRGWPD